MNEEKLLQPRLRFLGFEELCWENKSLGEVVNFYSGLTYSPSNIVRSNGTLVLRSSNVQNGRLAFENNVYVESKVVNSNNVKVGDIVVVVRNGSKSLIGKHAQILTPMPNTVIGAFMTGIRTDQSNFVNALLDTPLFKKAVEKNLGATINQITTGVFKEMEFHFSSSDKEQTKIGNFFTNTDQQLILHQSKLTKLKHLKKAMLGKMFPKQGATVPEVRFSGFNNVWKTEYLEANARFSKGKGYSKSDLTDSGQPIVLYGRLYTNYQTTITSVDTFVSNKSASVISTGKEVIVPASGETAEDIARASAVLQANVILGGDLNIIYPNSKILPSFLALIITYSGCQKELAKKAQGKSVVHIRNSDLKGLLIPIPSVEEQTKISDYFQSLDHLIALQQQQIKKLENVKQSFLEKMFV